MDPVSILSAVSGVGKLAVGCSTELYSFISSSKNVDVTVTGLYHELQALKTTSDVVCSTLQRPELAAFEDGQLWAHAQESVGSCDETLRQLERTLKGLRNARNTDANFLKKGISQIKLNLSADQVKQARDRIHSHQMALQTVLQCMEMMVTANGTTMVMSEVVPRLNVLEGMVEQLLKHNQEIGQSTEQTEVLLLRHDTNLARTNVQLAQSVKRVMDDVASSVSDDASTTWEGSELSLNFASSDDRQSSRTAVRSTSSANLTDWAEKISGWDDGDDSRSEKTLTPSDYHRASHKASVEVDDSDDETELELLEQCVKFAKLAVDRGDNVKAEGFLTKALSQHKRLSQLPEPIKPQELRFLRAKSLMCQSKLVEARAECDKLVKTQIRDDTDRVIIHDSLYLLAQIDFQENLSSDANWRCKQAMKGFRKLGGKSNSFYCAMALMVVIAKAQGDDQQSELHNALLPAGFHRPTFRAPPAKSAPDQSSPSSSRLSEQPQPFKTPPAGSERLASLVPPAKSASDHTRPSSSSSVNRPHPFDTSTSVAKAQESSSPVLSEEQAWKALREYFPLYSKRVKLRKEDMNSFLWTVAQNDVAGVRSFLKARDPLCKTNLLPLEATPLHLAAACGHSLVVNLLLDHQFDIEAYDNEGNAPLHIAASRGNKDVVQVLLERDASIAKSGYLGYTALHCAASHGNSEIVELLLSNNAELDAQLEDGRTPLLLASDYGHVSVVETLLDHGAKIDHRTESGHTALMVAAFWGHDVVVEILLDHGASTTEQDMGSYTALMVASKRGHNAVVKTLLDRGASIDHQDMRGTTALMYAAYFGRDATVKTLLERGADRSIQNDHNKTALYWAKKEEHQAIVQLLEET